MIPLVGGNHISLFLVFGSDLHAEDVGLLKQLAGLACECLVGKSRARSKFLFLFGMGVTLHTMAAQISMIKNIFLVQSYIILYLH